MATYRRKPTLFNPRNLEELCGKVVSKKSILERKLYKCFPHNLNYQYSYEKKIDEIYEIIQWRHMRDERSFEKWFRKMVGEVMGRIEANKKDIHTMILIAENLEIRLLKFKKIFGMPLEVFRKIESMLIYLRRLL